MKKNVITLAFMLVFASTTVFADGETGHGNRTPDSGSAPTALSTSNQNSAANPSDNILNQFLNIIYVFIA